MRQVRNLYQGRLKRGDAALVSRRRGRASNCQKAAERERFLVWYSESDKRGRYRPKRSAEMFADETGIVLSKEAARQWLTQAGYWMAKSRCTPRCHPPRLTAFGQAIRKLDILHIPSSSPQARGRVERAHQTAQDRLAKELANRIDYRRLDEKSARKAANDYLQHR